MKKLRHRESKELAKCHMSQKRHKLKKQTKIQLYCTNLQNVSLGISHYCCCTQSPSHVQTKNPHCYRSRFYKDVFSRPRPAMMGTLQIPCCCSVTQWYPTLWDPTYCSTPGFPVLHHLPEIAQTHVHRLSDASNHLILCRPLLLLPSIFPSIRVFSNESAVCIRRPKYWNFSFIVSPSNEQSGLISFRIDWFDLLAVQVCLNKAPQFV